MHGPHQRTDRKGGVSTLGVIKCRRIAFDFGQYPCTSSFGVVKILQHEKTRSLAEDETVPARVKWNRAFGAGTVGAQQSGSLETKKRFDRELVYATGQHCVRLPVSD